MAGKLLSKSRYLNGLQCPKLLWITTNQKARLPQTDQITQHVFDQGHTVGELAKKLFPKGIDIPSDGFMPNIIKTRQLQRLRKPLFEAGVLSQQLYSRSDILNPVEDDMWDIIEVKSSTSVKEINCHDVSFQKLCWEKAGAQIRKCFIACINNQYVREEEIEPDKLFSLHDITEEVNLISQGISERISQMLATIKAPYCPEVTVGQHCCNPYSCALAECWEGLPEHNVFTLYYGCEKANDLYSSGVSDIVDIPDHCNLSDKQRIQCQSVASGQPHIDHNAITHFLEGLKYPVYFVDFETFSTAIPLFRGVKPYQNIPFQFSLHVQPSPGNKPEHHSFLAKGESDPRPEFLSLLKSLTGNYGSIVVYDKSFKDSVLKHLAVSFPEYSVWVEDIISRMADISGLFKNFHYYSPAQKGSTVLKHVLPTITGLNYDELPIASGDYANLAFLSLAAGNASPDEIAHIRKELAAYCELDTKGLVEITEKLRELTKSP